MLQINFLGSSPNGYPKVDNILVFTWGNVTNSIKFMAQLDVFDTSNLIRGERVAPLILR